MVVNKLELIVSGNNTDHPISLNFYNFFDGLFAIFWSLCKRVKEYFFIVLYGSPPMRISFTRQGSPSRLREKLQKLSPLNSAAAIDIDLLKQTSELVMDEFISLIILNSISEQPYKLLEIDVVVVDDKLLLDRIDALVVKRHDDVAQIIAVGGVYYEFLLLTQVLQ